MGVSAVRSDSPDKPVYSGQVLEVPVPAAVQQAAGDGGRLRGDHARGPSLLRRQMLRGLLEAHE